MANRASWCHDLSCRQSLFIFSRSSGSILWERFLTFPYPTVSTQLGKVLYMIASQCLTNSSFLFEVSLTNLHEFHEEPLEAGTIGMLEMHP